MGGKQKSSYAFLWGDYQTLWSVETNQVSFKKFRKENIWNEVDNVIQILHDNRCFCFHSSEDLKNDIEKGKLFFNNEFFKKLIQNMEKRYQRHWKFFHQLYKTDFSKLSDKELYSYFLKTADNWSLIIGYFRMTQAEATHYLVEEIKKHFSGKETSLLILSPDLDIANKEQIDWQKLVKQKYSKKRLLEHATKYAWSVMKHFTYEDVVETLTQRYNFDKKHAKFQDIIKEKEELRKRQEKILKKYPKLKPLVKLIHRLTISRMEIKSCWASSDFYLIPLFQEIAKRKKELIYDISRYYLAEEIGELLKCKKLTQEEKIKRKQCSVALWKNGKIRFAFGKEGEELAKRELKELYKIKEIDKLKGTSANPGKAVGIARILEANNVEQTREVRKTFKKGQILITQMTQPNVGDIASRASALVTDEGGMLSHAAIISREFGIPCVVGTHFATTIIKDGDFIEVDANKGVVRKITKQEYELKKKKVKAKAVPKERLIKKTIKKVSMKGNIIWFKDLSIKDIDVAGGKGASLGEMYDLMPVPDGFVVSAQAYEKFAEDIKNKIFPILNIDVEDSAKLEKASKDVQKIILDKKIPQDIIDDIKNEYKKLGGFVACRSSATAEDLPEASFAGQQATYLNVKGDDNVIDAVKKCWASLFTARAIYYRVVNNFKHEDVLIAVVVQKMVNSQKAGVMFTVNPITNMKTEIVIEGAFGLGEMVVSGEITPDLYIVDKNKLEIKQKNVNEQEIGLFRDKKGNNVKMKVKNPAEQVLSDKQIRDLAILGVAIEKHYKKPEDIEWAVDEDDKIYILQSRPITTLK
jgi:phosphoenolpyruvate synthase/pyruvate phosphate dikinase